MRGILVVVAVLLPAVAFAASGDNGIAGGGSATDRSGTITSGSTSQAVMAANPRRAGCEIQNTGTADMWIGIDHAATSAGGSFWLPSVAIFICPIPTPTGAINVWSTAAGAAFTATEYAR